MTTLFPDDAATIVGTLTRLRAGETSCVAVVESCLARIDEREQEVRAWVCVDREGALRTAKQLDDELAAGKSRGSLHGIPLGIKDIVDLAGTATAAGSAFLAGQRPATKDAPVVAKLKAAGAIVLGKTVTTQFASFDPPVTRNPWNLKCTPGGSSSGSAAAVACGMCLGAIGSQTGGSITRPASFCGVAGCKPTFGLVSTDGFFPLSPNLDHPGPMARTVADLAILLDAIAEPTPAMNPWQELIGRVKPRASIFESLRDASEIAPPRMGRVRGFFDELADPAALAALDELLSNFGAAGATIRDIALPQSFADIHRSHRIIMAADAATHHRPHFTAHRDDYLPRIASLLEEGFAASQEEYARSRQHQERARHEILASFAEVDVLACLGALGPAPDASSTGDPAFNSPWSYVGLPLVSFPFALVNGLPISIQLIGRPFEEATVFRAAAWCERLVGQAASLPW